MLLNRRVMLAGIASAVAARALPAGAAGARIVGGLAFGTSWRIVMPAGMDAKIVASAMREVIGSVDAAMSPFRPDSEIGRFNATDSRDWQPLSPQTCDVVRASIEMASRSAGAFDPTVGPIVARYGFGPIRKEIGGGSYRQIIAGEDRVRKLDPRLTLDLCGIAKGHAVDRMAAALLDLQIADFLIEFGGELVARGKRLGGRGWQVGIERPAPGETAFQRIIRLDDAAIATSGDFWNSYVLNGRRYSHIIDPHRGEPVATDVASVSVLQSTTAAADALATALLAMGQEEGPALAERERISALFVVRDGHALREIMTGGFADAVIA